MKRLFCLSAMLLASMVTMATPTVTDVTAKQRYPWNGLVDISCKVSGIEGTANGFEFVASAIVPDLGITNKLSHFWVMKDGEKSTDRVVGANGNYRLLWDAKGDLGEVHYTNMVVNVIVDRPMVQLWEGGPYWALTNIGAEKPEDYGYYFWWGDTIGYKRENNAWVASDGSNSNFSFSGSNAPTYDEFIPTLQSEGWIVTTDGTNVLAPEHDAAQFHWGADWRMPTKQEFDDLNNNCDWTWMTVNGVNGYVVRGRDEYASNSIFLPSAGLGYGTSLDYAGLSGDYWSSVPCSDSDFAWNLNSGSGGHYMSSNFRYFGWPVRPVKGLTKASAATEVSADTFVGESASFLLNTTDFLTTTLITYDSSWIGDDENATVVIADNGGEIKRTTGEGEFSWSPATSGKHTLTYTTYIDGIAQDEMYTATVFKDWKYTLEDGKATITGTALTSGSVTIPSEIDGYHVVGIASDVFAGNTLLTSIVIPDSVYSIGANAFDGCSGLTRVEIPATLESIVKAGNVFANCSENLEIVYRSVVKLNVTAKQRYPWNGLVDISCKVSGMEEGAKGLKFTASAIVPDLGITNTLSNFWVMRDGEKSTDYAISTNGNYRLLWDAKADLGEVRYTNMVVSVTVKNTMVQLWEGGPYWATTNIGADEPWDYGYYFWWGDTIGYKWENDAWMASDGSNSNFSFEKSNTPTFGKLVSTLQSEGWITSDGVLTPEYDAAHVQWGGDWRMPTRQELGDLSTNCDWTWTTMNGVNGYVVSGRGDYASNSIFLPCVGTADLTSNLHTGEEGGCWSSEPHSSYWGGGYASWYIFFNLTGPGLDSYRNCWNGQSIRPVQGFTEASATTEVLVDTFVGESASFLLDTTDFLTTTPITYNSSWIGGNSSAEVVITDNGEEIKRTTGEGEFTWSPTTSGKHTLTYTTYINGVAQDEVYTATVFKDWKYTVEDGKATITGTALTTGSVTIPSEIDSYPVVGIESDVFANSDIDCVTIPSSLTNIASIVVKSFEQNSWIRDDSESGEVYQSNDIDHSGSTYMTATVTGPCEFSFDWKVSSESGYDKLKWYLNGSEQNAISGKTDWQSVTYSLEAGEHTIKWQYSKDGSVDSGSDCGWVRFAKSSFASFFDGCENLKSITMPWGLISCMNEIFPDSYDKLTNVTLTGEVTEIPDNAFAGCAALETFAVPDGVTKIGDNAFSGCASLKEIVIPGGVDSIGVTAFEGCSSLASVTMPWAVFTTVDEVLPDSKKSLVNLTLTGEALEVKDSAFAGCSAFETVEIPESVLYMGTNVFGGCASLKTTKSGDFTLLGDIVIGYEGAAEEIVIPNGVRGFCGGVFAGHSEIVAVQFPQSLQFVGKDAFAGCTGLEGVALPDSVIAVNDGAFRDCTWMQNIKMSARLEDIGAAAFANCAYLPSIECFEGLKEIGDGAFSNCWRMVAASLPLSLDSVGSDAFWNCKNVSSVVVPAHVQPLSVMFPASYSTLESIVIADGETELCEDAFAGCAGVTEIKLPSAIGAIPARAFKDCSGLDRLALPQGVLSIGDEAFSGCSRIGSLTLPTALESIGEKAFYGWELLEVVTIPDSVTYIGSNAFAGCTAVRQVRMPCNVATVSATFPDAYGEITHVFVPEDSETIIDGFLKGCVSITSFDIPDNVTEIGANAFSGCTNLAGLTLPDGLLSIGGKAFYGCDCIGDVAIPLSVASIGSGAFSSCTKVRSVTISGHIGQLSDIFPSSYGSIVSVTVISGSEYLADGIFAGCTSLKSVELPVSLTDIGERAFENCTSLAAVGIPSGVETLGYAAFRGCGALAAVALPDGLGVLEDEVFKNCSLLAAITIPGSVTEIGDNVFYGCDSLSSIKFVGNAPTVGSGSYNGVPGSLVTYVPYASTGWDGIETSKALPEVWPADGVNGIEWWDPVRFDVVFDMGDAGGESVVIEQVTDTSYILPDTDPVLLGATFAGWWTAETGGARITPVSRVMLTSAHTLYAHWDYNEYSVRFDSNGGLGAMDDQLMTVGDSVPLSANAFLNVGYAFAGWATEPDGEVVYKDGETVVNLSYDNGAAITLYAVWTEREWTVQDYLNVSGMEFAFDGDADWVADAATSHDGVASLRSGAIGASAGYPERTASTVKTTVMGEGSGSFWWKVSCEEMDEEWDEWYDYAVFTIDGVEVAKIAGDSGWQQVEYNVEGSGEHELAWAFTRDDYDEDGAEWDNAAWLDELVWTPNPVTVTFDGGGATGDAPSTITKYAGYVVRLPDVGSLVNSGYVFKGWTDGETVYGAGAEFVFGSEDVTLSAVWELKVWTLGEAVDAKGMTFATGGDSSWSVDTTLGYTNVVSAKSGAVTNGQSSWIEVEVSGAGELAFSWNVMGDIYRGTPIAYAKVEVDGTEIAQEYATDGWKEQTLTVEGTGTHTIRWTYLRTSSRPADGDCAWLDGVCWTPAPSTDVTVDVGGGKSVVVPTEWIEGFGDIVTAAGGDKAAALQRTAANGRRKVWECFMLGVDPTDAADDFKITRFWMEDGVPKFEFSHSTDGAGNSFEARVKMKGKAKLTDDWSDVPDGGNAAFRFFTVEVELP